MCTSQGSALERPSQERSNSARLFVTLSVGDPPMSLRYCLQYGLWIIHKRCIEHVPLKSAVWIREPLEC